MIRFAPPIRVLLIAAALFTPAALLGCQTAPTEPIPVVQAIDTDLIYRTAVVDCTHAIHAGDLDEARGQLTTARKFADSEQRARQVQSLDQLITGAEALLVGDGTTAVAAWSQIEDPILQREVRIRARAIGLDVPVQR